MDVELVDCKAINPAQLEAWQQLFESVPHARFYQHPHWFKCIADHLSMPELCLGFVSIDAQLRMVLPLQDSNAGSHRLHPAHDHLSLNDVLIHPSLSNDNNTLLSAINAALNHVGRNWAAWKITNIPQHSDLIQSLASISSWMDDDQEQATAIHFQTERDGTSDSWLIKKTRQSASFDCGSDECPPHGKLRRNLRRLRKQMSEAGTLRVENVCEPDQLQDAYQQFLNVEASGWKGAANDSTAIAANADLNAFYQSLLNPDTAGLQAEINLLWCDEHCVAAQFGMRTGHTLSLLKIGYDEAYARFSPGYLLLESILANAPGREITTLSLVTSPPWAERWHPITVPVWQLNHYNNSTRGIAASQVDRLKQAAKNRLKPHGLTS